MRKYYFVFFIFFLLLTAKSYSNDEISLNFYLSLSQKSKISLHRLTLKILKDRRINSNNLNTQSDKNSTLLNKLQFIENFFVQSAHAIVAQDDYLFCNFGGWVSVIDSNGNCLPPYSSQAKQNSSLEDYGSTYDQSYTCGKSNFFRCNPVIFGSPIDQGYKGYCVETNEKDPNAVIMSCIIAQTSDIEANHINRLSKDPELLTRYLAIFSETIRFCNDFGGKFKSCQELLSHLEKQVRLPLECTSKESLYNYLPTFVSPLNQEELDQIADGLGTNFLNYQSEQELQADQILQNNLKLYQKEIEKFQSDEKTKSAVEAITNNSTKCLMGSCKKSKNSGTSLGYCARYVKHALLDSKYLESYPSSNEDAYAVGSKNWLEPAGFVNLLEKPEFASLDPKDAPIGAVIVYKNTGNKKSGRPGHVEIKIDENKFGSDYIKDEPISDYNPQRVPIGIYVKIPDPVPGVKNLPGLEY